jgi:hypothetical protein
MESSLICWTIPLRRAPGALLTALALGTGIAFAQAPPLKTPILSASGEVRGEAHVYENYIEVLDAVGAPKGAVGVVMVDGRLRLFLVRSDQERSLIGWAENHRLYNAKNELVGYYYWTPVWSYVYDPNMKKAGEARCLAYQGVCAAAIAGYLLGLL